MRATRAVINLANLRHNIGLVRRKVGPGPKICMAVKADAYGHGVLKIVHEALASGVDWLAVATVEEGVELRTSGIEAPVLLMSFPLRDEVAEIVRHGLTPFAGEEWYLQAIESEAERQERRVDIHLKIDTGMGRIGCRPEEAPDRARRIAGSRHLRLAGIGTHFPVADTANRASRDFTAAQVDRIRWVAERVRELGIDAGTLHAANSGAVIAHPESHLDMVRPGIMLYGYYPSHQQSRPLDLRPLMTLESKIVFLKRVPPGTGISYGLTYRTREETTIATIPCGYGDGYSRVLSNKARVLVNGELYPVAGRVCMDQTMIDLGPHSHAKLFDRVVLFGSEEGAPTAEDVAEIMGTIPYEVTCNINKRVPRVYIDGQ